MRTTRAIFHLHSIPSEATVSVHFVEHIETQTDRQTDKTLGEGKCREVEVVVDGGARIRMLIFMVCCLGTK